MLIVQLFLLVSISVATADIIVDSPVKNFATAVQVDCGGKVCKNGATCKTGNICDCPKGTKGDECEIVIGCDKLKEKCDKINTECIYNPYLETATCKCSDEKKKFDGESCKDCDCGKFVASCELHGTGKDCFCQKGYADKYGTCSECSCGEFEDRCSFFKDEKNCMCKPGYSENSGICQSCTCGKHMESCAFLSGSKYCTCEKGYQFKVGTCEKCDCGENSTSCVYDEKAVKICLCKEGNKNRLGTCTACDCGPDTFCMFTSTGDKKCDCVGPLCREPEDPWYRNPLVVLSIIVFCGCVVGLVFAVSFIIYRKLSNRRNV